MAQNQPYQPIFILPEDTKKSSGLNAQRINIEAAMQVAEQVRTTLGPKGMDKMIVDQMGEVIVTNDGVTILSEMSITHPAAKMVVEVAKTQEDEVGDGTTTVVVLAGELLKNAQPLIERRIHPTVIAKGYRIAAKKSIEILNDIATPIKLDDRQKLMMIAQTAMTGKGAEQAKTLLSKILIDAMKSIADKTEEGHKVEKSHIKIEKKVGGSIEDSEMVEGIMLDKEKVHSGMPSKVEGAKIALINTPLEIRNTEIDAKIQITSPNQMQEFLDQEEAMMKKMTDKIVESGANVVFCQKGIDELAQHYLAKKGILAARRVKQSDMGKLSMATGGKILNNLEDLTQKDLGRAGIVEQSRLGDDEMLFVRNCRNPKAVSIIVRGGTEHVVDEVKRAVDDALGDLAATINDGWFVAGAGSPEIELAMRLKKYSETLSGKEQLAVEAFAKSMEIIPRTLAENTGYDPIDKVATLKSMHDGKNVSYGFDAFTGKIKDAIKMGVIEPLKIKTQAVSSASDVAVMILRIDDVIVSGAAQGQSGAQGQAGMPYPTEM